MNTATSYSTWVEIDLDAIRNNIQWFLVFSGVPVMAVVKANAYGHGMIPVARAALQAGASWCGVARIEEAFELRTAGLNCPILVMGYTPPNWVEKAVAWEISMTVWHPDQIDSAASTAKAIAKSARLHLKVDTGMSRLGVQPEMVLRLAQKLAETHNVTFEGLFTHFARADEADPSPTDAQELHFQNVIDQLKKIGMRPSVVHAANSAASLTRPSTYFDLIRVGIAMYGLHPSNECSLPGAVRAALTWKAVLSQVKVLPPGRGVSYGHIYTTRSEEQIATVPVGYADGFRRTTDNQVLVAGKRVPVIGRVTMDQIMIQLDWVPGAKAGDEVVLVGQQGEERITAEDVAKIWRTINYEVTCAISTRVPRVYLHETT
ncbi:MAG: alanine racemase [Chloroflexi bacterium RBG_13_50_21]|nr:MAG: alanine racemase [Chloroflexi bacterium RBG_13_50_21]OGO66380.1 MAG: alanine racemase [Chloroflexi bacterium RBG_19FT_COMBO_50_10]